MSRMAGVLFIAASEIGIGILTFFLLLIQAVSASSEPGIWFLILGFLSVFASCFFGIGLLKFSERARHLLVGFSFLVLLNKVLLVMNMSSLSSFVDFGISDYLRNVVSFSYHTFIILFLSQPRVRACFLGY
jgi:hypothetical protein